MKLFVKQKNMLSFILAVIMLIIIVVAVFLSIKNVGMPNVLENIMKSNSETETYALNFLKHINSVCDSVNKSKIDEKYKNVYIIPNVFSEEECKWMIYEAEQYAKQHGWTRRRHSSYPTVDNEIKNIPNIAYFVESRVYSKVMPEFERFYDIQSKYLGIDETFIAKYSIGGQSYLEPHKDGDDFSFVVTLNKDFEGGGTYFLERQQHIDATIGSAVIFCGRNEHMGKAISSGIRYIIAGFCSYGKRQYCDNIDEGEKKDIFIPYNIH